MASSHIWLWLIWGLTATHSKDTYNGSSWQDYEGCESTQLNGGRLETLIQLASLSLFDSSNHCQSRRIVAPGRSRTGHLLGDTGCPIWPFRSRWTLTCVFHQSSRTTLCFLLYLLSPWFHYPRMCHLLWTKRRPFSWVTVSFHSVVIGFLLSLCGLDTCTEIEVQWPCGAPTFANCKSLTAFKVDH